MIYRRGDFLATTIRVVIDGVFFIDCYYKVIYRWSDFLAATIRVVIDEGFFLSLL